MGVSNLHNTAPDEFVKLNWLNEWKASSTLMRVG